jgi:hypothetical protein
MQRITPTHFIEQYNTKWEEREWLKQEQTYYDSPLSIEHLEHQLSETAKMSYRHTVAVWKIAPKQLKTA